MRKVYRSWVEEILKIVDETDFSEYNFDTQKTITLPYLGEIQVKEGKVKQINRKLNGRTKVKKDTGEE